MRGPPLRQSVVHDEEEACPYLPTETARTPLRWPSRALLPHEVDLSLAAGDRRVGPLLYRTACPSCHACEPLRIPVAGFRMSRTQRRVWRRNQDLRIEVGPVQVDAERVALFNRHRQERGLALRDAPMEEEGYARWFLETSVPTVEMRYRLGDRLVGVGIVDLGQHDSSSVYFYFDPDASARSPGTFGVLAEVAWLHARGGRHHYLGLHVGACGHLAYKASFHPHERLVGGRWIRFP